ncbi:asparaginase [Clostridium folliculivorans]|uniref:L-asparaginase n=1 Tax=Clostridium folliculivorans TaxID=2886038 RepID=A0A9W5Y1L2_9CLOT|nr:asparaginase [Clostridium folliculivorans]GKU24817.1 L-asparaginase [Clostridium folliculivorans]GKU30915.1 L-asparaginase [Clostridium folliculivorans]
MKKIAIVFNGGTISMKVDPRIKAAVPSLTGEEIMSMVTGIESFAEIESYTYSSLPGPHMTPEIMLDLSKYVQKLLSRDDISGVVITHGTDSLEETAYLLDLTLDTEKPVVFTGAMRSSSELGYDGPSNLAASICTAISEEAKNRGVLVCFNGELNSAAEVTKVNSMALNAFRTPNFGPIGIVDNNRVIFYRDVHKESFIDIKNINGEVTLLKSFAGMDSRLIDFSVASGDKGIVIEAMGRGNIPPAMVDGIKRAIDKGVVVVVVSRCFEGRVYDSYGYHGGGKELRNLGVVFGDNMPGQKARIKLITALSYTSDFEYIKCLFERDLYK